MKQPIELRRLRDFGQIINDSFTFLKENFKPLFRALFIICGFFILISFISMVFTYLNITNVFTTNFNFDTNSYDSSYKPLTIFATAMASAFILVLTQAFITLVTLCYISVYLQKNNATPDLAEIWGYFRYYFWRVLGSGILIFFLLMIGTMLCLIPGIYLFPILYLVIPIIVIENCSFGYAFNKSFQLIKNNWWLVFGVIFIMSLIVGVAGSIVSIPITLFAKGGAFFSLKTFALPVVVVFSLFRSVLLLAYVLPSVAISLCYFNLAEEKEGTGLLNRIEKLGKPNNESNLPTKNINHMYKLLALVILTAVFNLFTLSTFSAVIKKAPAITKVDTSKITVKKFNAQALDKYKHDKDFNYGGEATGQPSFWELFWNWLWNLLFGWIGKTAFGGAVMKYFLLGLAVALLVYVVFKSFGIDPIQLWRGEAKKVEVPYSESLENIHEINFDEEIEKAVSQHNYRLAVRLLYLKCLKQLSDTNLIQWQIDKTNSAYIYELADPKQKQMFGLLTRQFEYVWYGDFHIDQQAFSNINGLFQNFKKQLQ